jgi:hypothetical protein
MSSFKCGKYPLMRDLISVFKWYETNFYLLFSIGLKLSLLHYGKRVGAGIEQSV